MDTLKETVYKVVAGYAGKDLNGYSYLTANPSQDVFTVTSIAKFQGKRIVHSGLVTHVTQNEVNSEDEKQRTVGHL